MLTNPSNIGNAIPVTTRALAQTLNIPIVASFVQTGRYDATGDGGGALYQRAISAPTHQGYFQDNTGAYFVLSKQDIYVEMFGARGDNVVNDKTSIQNAIDYDPGVLNFNNKLYRVNSGLVLNNPIRLQGANPRQTQILGYGNFNILSTGGLSRVSGITIKDITINGNSMTGGYAVNVDWAQDFLMDNCFINNPYNAVNVRQSGNTTLRNVTATVVRGVVGLDALGTNTSRNGENDQIDGLIFFATIFQSDYNYGGPVNNVVLCRLDGYVHTIQSEGLRLLAGGIGLQTLNTNALPSNLTPRFFIGSSLEVERMYSFAMDLQYGSNFWMDNIFAVGSYTQDGIRLGAGFADFAPKGGQVSDNNLCGINIVNCPNVNMSGMNVFNNSLVGSGVKSGIFVSGSGKIVISKGLSGKNTDVPAYTENQKAGVDLDPAFSGTIIIDDVCVLGNVTVSISPSNSETTYSNVRGCAGYNPRGPANLGVAPATYTAGLTEEYYNISGGTGVLSASIGGVPVGLSGVMASRQTIAISSTITMPNLVVNRM